VRPFIRIEDLTVEYRSPSNQPLTAIDRLNLDVAQGEFISVVGPSGCGKSTLLMAVDGLLQPVEGRIEIDGTPVTAPGRDRAVVFQEFALLPWRTVRQNVAFGLEGQRMSKARREETVSRYLRLVGLENFAGHYPSQLSGGMRQRVGIARALAVEPQVLLMDEPFGALDAQTREILGEELLRIWDAHQRTVLFITHDIDEAVFLSDRVAVMTRRPARIKEIMAIDLPRPRTIEVKSSKPFGQYRRRIWDMLHDEAIQASRER